MDGQIGRGISIFGCRAFKVAQDVFLGDFVAELRRKPYVAVHPELQETQQLSRRQLRRLGAGASFICIVAEQVLPAFPRQLRGFDHAERGQTSANGFRRPLAKRRQNQANQNCRQGHWRSS